MFASLISFSKKAASLPKMVSLLWYFTEDLNLLVHFDHSIGLTTKCAMVKVSENVEEDEPLSQTPLDMANTKSKTIFHYVIKNSRRLICLTNQLEILHSAASKVFSGCLSSFPFHCFLLRPNFPVENCSETPITFMFWTCLAPPPRNHLTSELLAKNQ